MNNQIPYKLSNVIYHLPKLLDSFSAGGLREVKKYFKQNGYDLTIQYYGVENLLDIIMKEICVEGNWNELSYNMEYNNFEKKQLSLFFQNFYNDYTNKTLVYQEFFTELLQSNIDDLEKIGFFDGIPQVEGVNDNEIDVENIFNNLSQNFNNLNKSKTISLINNLKNKWQNRNELIQHLISLDKNGIYSDKDSIAEYGVPATMEELLTSLCNLTIDGFYPAELEEILEEDNKYEGLLPTTVSFDLEYLDKAEEDGGLDCIQGVMAFLFDGLRHTVNFKYYEDNTSELFDVINQEGETDELFPSELEEKLKELLEQNVNKKLFSEEDKNFEEGDYVTNGRGSSGKIIQIGNSEAKVLVDYDNGPVEPYVCNFYLDELNKVDTEDDTEDDDLDEEELENERPFDLGDQNLLLTIIDNLDKNFPIPRVEFYYPFENVECSTLMSLEKIKSLLSDGNSDYESIMVVDDYKLVTLMPDIIEFEDLMSRLLANIPGSNLENNEDVLYMNLSDGTNNIKLKIYVSAELYDILAN